MTHYSEPIKEKGLQWYVIKYQDGVEVEKIFFWMKFLAIKFLTTVNIYINKELVHSYHE